MAQEPSSDELHAEVGSRSSRWAPNRLHWAREVSRRGGGRGGGRGLAIRLTFAQDSSGQKCEVAKCNTRARHRPLPSLFATILARKLLAAVASESTKDTLVHFGAVYVLHLVRSERHVGT